MRGVDSTLCGRELRLGDGMPPDDVSLTVFSRAYIISSSSCMMFSVVAFVC